MTRKLAILAALVAWCASAFAQAPVCPANYQPPFATGGSVFGFLAQQWAAFFGGKADINGGQLCTPTITSPTFKGTPVFPGGQLGTMAYQNSTTVAITGGSITGMPAPVNPADVATKAYVDGQVQPAAVVVTTSGGSYSIPAAQNTTVWKPSAPASNAVFTLPATPNTNLYTLTNDQSAVGFSMALAANAGQSIDPGAQSALVVVNPGDSIKVRYVAANQWVVQ